jgi:phage antirepressor YoqD-like protein
MSAVLGTDRQMPRQGKNRKRLSRKIPPAAGQRKNRKRSLTRKCAEILGHTNPERAIREFCRGVTETVTPTAGGAQTIKVIPEGDIYRLIIRSKLPSAVRFEKWLFEDVVPSIRKHNLYAAEDLLANPDLLIQAATALKEERAKNAAFAEKVTVQTQQIAELTPKASYYDLILQCQGIIPITVIAKDYGQSGTRLNNYLHELGVQYKVGDTWVLYQQYARYGYTQTKTHNYVNSKGQPGAKINTYWTQSGRLFLYQLLKGYGLLPTIERDANAEAARDFGEDVPCVN